MIARVDAAPTVEKIEGELRRVFGDRLSAVAVHGWHATATVSTARYRRVTLDELVRAASLLGIAHEAIEMWDVRGPAAGSGSESDGGIEISIDLDETTPIQVPAQHGEKRRR
jgi:hypothetical protein